MLSIHLILVIFRVSSHSLMEGGKQGKKGKHFGMFLPAFDSLFDGISRNKFSVKWWLAGWRLFQEYAMIGNSIGNNPRTVNHQHYQPTSHWLSFLPFSALGCLAVSSDLTVARQHLSRYHAVPGYPSMDYLFGQAV